jgi:hypothetical protein
MGVIGTGGYETIYHRDDPSIRDHDAVTPFPGNGFSSGNPGEITLTFNTPMRLQQQGRPLHPGEITARALLMALIRRVGLISEFHTNVDLKTDYQSLSALSDDIAVETSLSWKDWRRYSNRQKQKMSLGGVIGEVSLRGDLSPFAEHLYVGQWLHVGKNATFGLGRYEAESH